MRGARQVIVAVAVPSNIHLNESVRERIRRDVASRFGCLLNGDYLAALHVRRSFRLAENYSGLSLRAVNEVALRYLLEHVDSIAPHSH